MLQHANPVKLTGDLVGVALCIFFLWVNRPIFALVFLFGFSLLGNIIVWRVDIDALAKTSLGKWMLGQAKPANLIIRTVGFSVFLLGVWLHAFSIIVGGVLFIVLARMVGTRGTPP